MKDAAPVALAEQMKWNMDSITEDVVIVQELR